MIYHDEIKQYQPIKLVGGLLDLVVKKIEETKARVDMAEDEKHQTIGELLYDSEKKRYMIGVPLTFVREGKTITKEYQMVFFPHEIHEGAVHKMAILDRTRRCVNFFRSRGMEVKKLNFVGLDKPLKNSVTDILSDSAYNIVPLSQYEKKDFEKKKHLLLDAQIGSEKEFHATTSFPERDVVHVEFSFHIRDKNGYEKVEVRRANFHSKQIDISEKKPWVLGIAVKSLLEYQTRAFNKRHQEVQKVDLEKTGFAPAIQSYLQDCVAEQNKVYRQERSGGKQR